MKLFFSARNLALMIGLSLAGAGLWHSSSSRDEGRTPAALHPQEKPGFLQSEFPRGMTQKIRGSLTVKIRALNEFDVNQPLIYEAVVNSDSDLALTDYKWILPRGMEILKGTPEGHLVHLTAGEPQTIEITLLSLTDENRQLHIHVTGQEPGILFTASDQYNTKDQPVIDAEIKVLAEKTRRANRKKAFQ
jgi:hypothetical protein